MSPALPLPRRVEPEILDRLAADDPRARRTRSDLRRINRIMSTLSIVLDGVDRIVAGKPPRSILELGAGDGSLMLRIAEHRRNAWPGVSVTLLDRQPAIDSRTLERIRATGWNPAIMALDVEDWLVQPVSGRCDLIVANLFVHHFADAALQRLFAGIAARAGAFYCSEPRRTALALTGSHLVGLLGAGPVARFDAVASVHAGFRDGELSAAWPASAHDRWSLREYDAGLFTHCLAAARAERQ